MIWCGCLCRLARTCAAHINSTQIAIWASTWDFGAVVKAQTSLWKYADSPEPSLLAQKAPKSQFEPAYKILVRIAFYSGYIAQVSLCKYANSPVFAAPINGTQIAICGSKWFFYCDEGSDKPCKCVNTQEPSLLAYSNDTPNVCNNRRVVSWNASKLPSDRRYI